MGRTQLAPFKCFSYYQAGRELQSQCGQSSELETLRLTLNVCVCVAVCDCVCVCVTLCVCVCVCVSVVLP